MDLLVFTEPQQGASYDELLAVATAAEQAGFTGFFRSDHYLKMGSVDGRPGPTDAWVTLAGLARETSRLRLGTLVSAATFRLPGPLAVTVAQVDAMSGGRVELGLGTGWYEDEHTAYGIPFPPLRERFERLEEQLAVVTGLWETPEGETFAFEGRHYRLDGSPALPKPVQRPRPPIVVGGWGTRRTPELAARFADEFNMFAPLDDFRAGRQRVVEACEAIGRDPATMRWSAAATVVCGTDEAEVERRAAATGRTPAQLRDRGVAGTPAEVVDRLGRWAEAGADRVYLQVLDVRDLDHIALLGDEVVGSVQGTR